jgi:Ca-activated chloride channel family protein
MTFGQPFWLFGLLLIPALVGLIWRNSYVSRKRLEKLAAPRLLPELADSVGRRILKRVLYLVALASFICAMARPQLGYIDQEITQKGRDIMLAIDTSKSMLAQDVVPDRLTRAKLAAQDILNSMTGDRIGLIAFAGTAQVEAPLTLDNQTVFEAINDLNTNTVEKGGTDISAAIRSAEFAFGKSETSYRALVILTDGEDLEEDAIAAAKEVRSKGFRIFTVGIGTKEGGLIPAGQSHGEFLRDRDSQFVKSRLDERRLNTIAATTGGFYVHLESDAITQVVHSGLQQLDKSDIDQHLTHTPIERYRWPLSLGLILLVFSTLLRERRRRTQKPDPAVVAVLFFLFGTISLSAESAANLYDHGEFDAAFEKFGEQLKNDPNSPELNLGAGNAAFRLKKFDEAFENYSKAMTSNDLTLREHAYYNAGNSLFLKGNDTEEIEEQLTRYYDARYQYHQALDLNPQDDQARKNLQLLEDRIKQAEQQKRQQQEQSQQHRKKKSKNKDHGQPNQKSNQPGQPGDGGQSGDPSEEGDDPKQDDPSGNDGTDMPEKEPTPKKEGQLKENTPSQSASKPEQELGPPRNGQMSSDEAMGLLNSLRDEGQRLDLSKKKGERRVTRDW